MGAMKEEVGIWGGECSVKSGTIRGNGNYHPIGCGYPSEALGIDNASGLLVYHSRSSILISFESSEKISDTQAWDGARTGTHKAHGYLEFDFRPAVAQKVGLAYM